MKLILPIWDISKFQQIQITIQELYRSMIPTGSKELFSITSSIAQLKNVSIQPPFKIMLNPPELLSREEPSTTSSPVTTEFMLSSMLLSSKHTHTMIQSTLSTWFQPPD